MRRKLGVTLALMAVLVAAIAVPSGSAATKKAHKLDGALVARGLEGDIVTGTFTGQPGSGAVIYKITVKSDGTQDIAIQGFFAKGALRGKGNVTVTPQSDGTATFTGSAKITGGTGAYKGAKGAFTTNGTIDSTGLIKANNVGSVKY